MLISLSGVRGSGKDTIANYLVSKYGFTAISWADSLKDVLSAVFGWDRQMLEGNTPESRHKRSLPDEWWEKRLGWFYTDIYKEKRCRFTPLFAMTYIGTDIFRQYVNKDIWVNSLLRKLEDIPGNIVIRDTRFPNEINTLYDKGAFFVTVSRGPLKPYSLQASDINWKYRKGLISFNERDIRIKQVAEAFCIHESEISWESFTDSCLLFNDSTIECLHRKVDGAFKVFIEREGKC